MIVGLDLSLTATGVCRNGELHTITTKKKGVERLWAVQQEVKGYSHGCSTAMIEGYSFGSQGRAVFNIGELGGVIRLMLWIGTVKTYEVPPSTLKKYATGAGNANKSLVVQEAAKRSGITFLDDNQADAWWLWQIGLHLFEPNHRKYVQMPKLNVSALDKLEV